MDESIYPGIIVSSLANETMTEKGIQSATGNELLKKLNISWIIPS